MPCTYDDIPGSWGQQSQDWPSIADPDQRVRMLVIKSGIVPYGSYVTVGDQLRLENEHYIKVVRKAIANKLVKS